MSERPTVAHDVGVWLARTKTWLYNEVKGVEGDWRSVVLATRLANTLEFPHDEVFSLKDDEGRLRWLLEMSLCRLGVTRRPLSITRQLRRLAPNVLHSHFGHVGWSNAHMARQLAMRHVVSFYGYDVTRLPRKSVWKRRYCELFSLADRVLCEGPHMRNSLIALGSVPERTIVYPLGVAVDRIEYREPSWRGDRPLQCLFAASFREKKGLPYGLAAVAHLRRLRRDLDIHVTVVGVAGGSKESLRERDRIYSVVELEGLGDVVTFRGDCSHAELLSIANRSDLFISPSITACDGDTEGGAPVTIVEMAASGLPIISTTHCDIPYVLGEMNGELLVPERDIDALANILSWLVDNPQQWPTISSENRHHVEENLDLRRQGPALAAIYSELIDA